MSFTKEDVEILAYRRYKSGELYECSVWYLAELCVTINKNIKNGFDVRPLETETNNLVFLLRDDVDGILIKPAEQEIKQFAEQIHHENPSKSELHWYIAEKQLMLKEIQNIIQNREKNS